TIARLHRCNCPVHSVVLIHVDGVLRGITYAIFGVYSNGDNISQIKASHSSGFVTTEGRGSHRRTIDLHHVQSIVVVSINGQFARCVTLGQGDDIVAISIGSRNIINVVLAFGGNGDGVIIAQSG